MFLRYSMWSILEKNIIKVQVVGYIHINRLLHGKMKIISFISFSNSTMKADGSRSGYSIPKAVFTVVRAPDGGCLHPKHVELPTVM